MQLIVLVKNVEDYMLPCLNKKFFGIDCPGCGIQRAFLLLIKGDFAAAFDMYPAIYPLILLFGFLLASTFFKIKHASKIIATLAITSVLFILTNYFLKL